MSLLDSMLHSLLSQAENKCFHNGLSEGENHNSTLNKWKTLICLPWMLLGQLIHEIFFEVIKKIFVHLMTLHLLNAFRNLYTFILGMDLATLH